MVHAAYRVTVDTVRKAGEFPTNEALSKFVGDTIAQRAAVIERDAARHFETLGEAA